MENTTRMYIEHIVIGMQVTLLLFVILVSLDPSIAGYLKNISSVMEIVIVIPISYSLGIFIDRVYKNLPCFSEEREKPIKQEACKYTFGNCIRENTGKEACERCKGCERDRISIQVWKHFEEMDYYVETMARKRILRAMCVNSWLSFITLVILVGVKIIFKKIDFLSYQVIIFLIIILLVIGICCGIIYRELMKEYYRKQKKYIQLFLKGKLI